MRGLLARKTSVRGSVSSVFLPLAIMVVSILAAISGVMLASVESVVAQEDGPEMRLVITGGDCNGDTCTVPEGGAFTMAVEVVSAPSEGYIGVQSYLDFGTELVYNVSEDRQDEVVWPDCAAGVLVRAQSSQRIVNHGCLTGIIPPLVSSTYTGILWELSFNCSGGPSSTLVELVSLGEERSITSGAGFQLESLDQVVARVSDLTIICGSVSDGGQLDTPAGVTDVPSTPADGTDTPSPETDTPEGSTMSTSGAPDGESGSGQQWVLYIVVGVIGVLIVAGGAITFSRRRRRET